MYPAFSTNWTDGSYCNCMKAQVPMPFITGAPSPYSLTSYNALEVGRNVPYPVCNGFPLQYPNGSGALRSGLIVGFSGWYNYSSNLRGPNPNMFYRSRWCPVPEVSNVQRWSFFDFENNYWANKDEKDFKAIMDCSRYDPPPSTPPPPPYPPPELIAPPASPDADDCTRECRERCEHRSSGCDS